MTRPLAALEQFFERLFERPAARLFQTGLEPVQVQRRLERVLDAGNRAGTGFVPDRFNVYVNPEDGDSLEDLRTTLEAELAEGLLARAHQRRYRLAQRPIVAILADPSVPRGEVAIEAGYGPPLHAAPRPDQGDPSVGPAPAPPASLLRGMSEAAQEPPTGRAAVDWGAARSSGDTPPGWPPEPEIAPLAEQSAEAAVAPGIPPVVFLVRAPGVPEGEFPLEAATVTIGRGPENDLVLPDRRVSRRHGMLSVRRGTLVYTDLGSSNGTLVNGRLVTEVALGHGDVLQIGDSTITVFGTG